VTGSAPYRILVAKPGLDGHDRGAKMVARALRDAGFEVIYTGLHRTIHSIAVTARDEDVDAVGLSVLSGAHLAYTSELRATLDDLGLEAVPIVVGGIIPPGDVTEMHEAGAVAVFPPNSNLLDIPIQLRALLDERNNDDRVEVPHA
jgi:methylmalonyl-CoA mutase C-terminal domain/subunit